MTPVLLSELHLNAMVLIIVAVIAATPGVLAAYWSRSAQKMSSDALSEVKTNGGMTDPHPNLNDHVKYQTVMSENLVQTVNTIASEVTSIASQVNVVDMKVNTVDGRVSDLGEKVQRHIAHSNVMDQALAEVYFEVKPTQKVWPQESLNPRQT